jgi:predicted  nucleic acid-binding Zn-ribbon protein
VTAEVFVDDVRWVVARPLGIGHRSFCLRDRTIDDVADTTMVRQDYREFLQALAKCTTDGLTSTKFPTTDKPVGWEHVLPWLMRDQDCRFADFLVWRHSSSGSEAPALNVEERQFLVRTVLGLISDEERAELQRNAQLLVDKKEAERLEPLLQHQAETDHRRLSNGLGKELPVTSTPLFGSETRAELARRRDALEKRRASLEQNDRREALRTGLEVASKHEGALEESIRAVRDRLEGVKGVTAELAREGQSELLSSLPPPRDFCNVLLSEARESGCPLAVGRPIEIGAKRSQRAADDELAAKRVVVAGLEREVKRLEGEMKATERTTKDARRDYLSANTAYTEAQSKLQDARSKLEQLDRLVDAAEGAAEAAAGKGDAVKKIARDIEDSYTRQEEIREAQRAALHGFSTRFDYVVRALIGDQVTGCVETSGRSLSLSVEERGDRDSAAIATLKLLAFDLAAIVASIEGEGVFPRFLVHDGPREADMAPNVYERLFLFAHELEKCFGEKEPGFQYIITTTTAPPDKFIERDTPWLRLRLSGLPARERFLGQDL